MNKYLSNPITKLLILVNITIMATMMIMNHSLKPIPMETLKDFGALTHHASYSALLFHMFLHVNLLHISCNMLSLLVYGSMCEKTLGSFYFFLFYIITGLGAAVGVLIFANPAILAVGASGAICGIVGMQLTYILFKKDKKNYMPVFIDSALLLLIGLIPQVSFIGHAFGFITGVILMTTLCLFNEQIKNKKLVIENLPKESINKNNTTSTDMV